MQTKLQMYQELSEQASKQLWSDTDYFRSFLVTSARLYKYRFKDQLMIHDQRPDAVACAEYDTWGREYIANRFVKRGSKGIALIDDSRNKTRLRYVFDFTDTSPRDDRSKEPFFWRITEENRQLAGNALGSSTGSIDSCLINKAHEIAKQYSADYVNELFGVTDGTFLKELDELNVQIKFEQLLETSISYSLLSRCGYEPSAYFDENDFRGIHDFNSIEAISVLGTAVSDLSEQVLRNIERTLKDFERSKENERDDITENNDGEWNRVHSGRGNTDLSSEPEHSGGQTDWQVRNAPQEIPQGEPQSIVSGNADKGNTGRTSQGDRSDSTEQTGNNDSRYDESGRGDGTAKGNRSDEMGGIDEQSQTFSRRDNHERTDIQLNINQAVQTEETPEGTAFFMPESETFDIEPEQEVTRQIQLSLFGEDIPLGKPTKTKSSLFIGNVNTVSVLRDEIMRGSGFTDGKFRIDEYYRKNRPDTKEFADFLKKEYGTGGHSGNGDIGFVDHDSKGICIRIRTDNGEQPVNFTWNEVAKYTAELLDSHKYITPEDINDRIRHAQYVIANYRNDIVDKFHYEKAIKVLTQYGLMDKNAELSKEMYDSDNPKLSGSHIAEIEVFATIEMWERFDASGVTQMENSEKRIILEIDGEGWNKFVIPDTFGNLTNSIDAFDLLTPAEYETMKEIVKEVFAEQEINKKIDIFDWEVVNQDSSETTPIQKHNFHITDDDVGVGGAKTKYHNNVEAIKLLNTIEGENRLATPDEQEILSKYVGWGGLSNVFDSTKSEWSSEYNELKSLLSPEEYESARSSTLNAYYTSPIVINAIYQGIENLGFKSGNVLEPSMGVGNFFGMMPEAMHDSKLYGVELDGITGRIAKQLYQTADIQVCGYEKTSFPDNFFDVAVGNVPFGDYKLSEKRYDKLNLNIHDHFFAKSLDKVRAGGVVAFVTSKGTLDKNDSKFRKYLAQRAELLGAVRLPNDTFKSNAGTEVTSDIIFLQKRDKMVDIEPDWVNIGQTAGGVPVNKYFEEHPEMILGEMKQGVGFSMYGNSEETSCVPIEGASLKEQLRAAIQNIKGKISEIEIDEIADGKMAESMPSDMNVRNFSFTVVDDKVYYRENSRMNRVELSKATEDRIKDLVKLRDCVKTLIDYQLNEYSDSDIKDQQCKLNSLYDNFTNKYGLISSSANSKAFSQDSSYYLLSSLEVLDEQGNLERKADMFTRRTIKQKVEVTSVDTASEALAVSISEKAKIDIPFMAELTGKSEEYIVSDLKGVIFQIPDNLNENEPPMYVTSDEYLSGNIREKLETAKLAAATDDSISENVTALEQAMPTPLTANEIDVRLGATWIDTDTVKRFICDTLQVPRFMQRMFDVHFSKFTSEWNIEGKNVDRNNVMANMTFGTTCKNAYSIIEDTLNLRDARVYDRVEQPDGKITSVLNKKETMLAQEKQEAIKNAFKEWIFKDPERREKLVNKYNELFNSTRPREYDGSHITFSGMTPEIKLRTHQLNAIAHTMYGGNTLLAHQVGAGKSFEMIASAMECKRLGLCTKSLFVVPNHLTEQMGAEFLRLYSAANILVATKKDFEAKNRKRLCSKIATGDYDAVIIGHSQLEKIPVSQERQERMMRNQIAEITDGIESLGKSQGARFSVKQLEKTKKNLEAKLDRLINSPNRDNVVTFEELGVDKMYVDEAHCFKNLFLYTKMRNVAGIQQTEAQKSADLYMKCQYLDELTGGKGIVFATGTPISNSMTELYTMMRYLQADKLKEMGMHNFDAWAANFGEAVTAIELAPEGTGYREKTRFSKFFNLPELMNVFKETADIKTADMLNLPVPEAHFHNVVVKPTDTQKDMVADLSERAKLIHDKAVDPTEDNMLKVTNDGRKIGLDQRLINPLLPDEPGSKVNACVDNIFSIYDKTAEQKSTQLVFCDFSTPKNDGSFNLYDDIRDKLISKGVLKEEIAFIHDADTEVKKKELFAKIRQGKVRVLLGSTAKCGAGTNIQDKLVALHHLDCPWRPSDLERASVKTI